MSALAADISIFDLHSDIDTEILITGNPNANKTTPRGTILTGSILAALVLARGSRFFYFSNLFINKSFKFLLESITASTFTILSFIL